MAETPAPANNSYAPALSGESGRADRSRSRTSRGSGWRRRSWTATRRRALKRDRPWPDDVGGGTSGKRVCEPAPAMIDPIGPPLPPSVDPSFEPETRPRRWNDVARGGIAIPAGVSPSSRGASSQAPAHPTAHDPAQRPIPDPLGDIVRWDHSAVSGGSCGMESPKGGLSESAEREEAGDSWYDPDDRCFPTLTGHGMSAPEPAPRRTHRGARPGRDRTEAKIRHELRQLVAAIPAGYEAPRPSTLRAAPHQLEARLKRKGVTDTARIQASAFAPREPRMIKLGKLPTASDPDNRLDYFMRVSPHDAADYEIQVDFKTPVPDDVWKELESVEAAAHLAELGRGYGLWMDADNVDEMMDDVESKFDRRYYDRKLREIANAKNRNEATIRNAIARLNRKVFGAVARHAGSDGTSICKAVKDIEALVSLHDELYLPGGVYPLVSHTLKKWARRCTILPATRSSGVPVVTAHDAAALCTLAIPEFICSDWKPEPTQPYSPTPFELIEGTATRYTLWKRYATVQVFIRGDPEAAGLPVDVDPRNPEPQLIAFYTAASRRAPDYFEYPIRDRTGGTVRMAPTATPTVEHGDNVIARWRLLGGGRGRGRGRSGGGARGRGRSGGSRPPLDQPTASRQARLDVARAAAAAEDALQVEVHHGCELEAADAYVDHVLGAAAAASRAVRTIEAEASRSLNEHRLTMSGLWLDEYRVFWAKGLDELTRLVAMSREPECPAWGVRPSEFIEHASTYQKVSLYFNVRFHRVRTGNVEQFNEDLSGMVCDAHRGEKYIVPQEFIDHLVQRETAKLRRMKKTALNARHDCDLARRPHPDTRLAVAVSAGRIAAMDSRAFWGQVFDNPLTALAVYGPAFAASAFGTVAKFAATITVSTRKEDDKIQVAARPLFGLEYASVIPVQPFVEPICVGKAPPDAKLDPKHEVKAPPFTECDYPPKGKFGARITGPVFACPEVVNKCACSCHNSLYLRHLVPMPPAPDPVLTDAANELCKAIANVYRQRLSVHNNTRFVAMGSRLVESDMDPKKARNNFASWRADDIRPELLSAFLKNELGRHNPFDDPVDKGRVIQTYVNGATKVVLATEFYAYQKAMTDVMSVDEPYEYIGSDGKRTGVFLSMACGVTPEALGKWADFVDALCLAVYERDAKAYDSCINHAMTMLKLWLAQMCDERLAAFMAAAVHSRGWIRSKGGTTIEYSSTYTTKSGHNDTTSSNTLINAVITGNAMLRVGVKGYVIVAGDDMLMAITDMGGKSSEQVKRELMEAERRQGITPKAIILGDIGAAGFVSACFLKTPKGRRACPLLARQLTKLWSTTTRMPDKAVERYKDGVGCCFRPFRNVPIIGPLFQGYGRDAGFVPPGDRDFGSGRWFDSTDIVEDREQGFQALESRYVDQLGVTSGELRALDEFIMTLPPGPAACSHPVANRLIKLDMGLEERELACPSNIDATGAEPPDNSHALQEVHTKFKPGLLNAWRARKKPDPCPSDNEMPYTLRALNSLVTMLGMEPIGPPQAGRMSLADQVNNHDVIGNDQSEVGRTGGDAARPEVADAVSVPTGRPGEGSDPDHDPLPYPEDGIPPRSGCLEARISGERELGPSDHIPPVGQHGVGLGGGAAGDGLWCEPNGHGRLSPPTAEPGHVDRPVLDSPAERRGCSEREQQHVLVCAQRDSTLRLPPGRQVVHSSHDSLRPVQRWVSDHLPVRHRLAAGVGLLAQWGTPAGALLGKSADVGVGDPAVQPVFSGRRSEGRGVRAAPSLGRLQLHETTPSRWEEPRSSCDSGVCSVE